VSTPETSSSFFILEYPPVNFDGNESWLLPARMTLPHVLSNSLFQFIEGSTSRVPLGEKYPMGFLRTVPSRPPYYDLLAFFTQLQN